MAPASPATSSPGCSGPKDSTASRTRTILSGMTRSQFLSMAWSKPEGPLIEPPRFSPLIADPSFLFPSESPRGTWELYAHSAWGLHRYSSSDGRLWWDWGVQVRNAMRPFVRRLEGGPGEKPDYLLLYESYPALALPLSVLPWKKPWDSRIAASWSDDLCAWTGRETIVGADLEWKKDPVLGSSVSNPCLVEARGEWLLYHSASLSWIDDCGFCEPRYIALSRSSSPNGPFRPEPRPVIDPADDPLTGVIGGGLDQGPRPGGRLHRPAEQDLPRRPGACRAPPSSSSVRTMACPGSRPAPRPSSRPGLGWMSSHVYACDCREDKETGIWYLYFNARDGWRTGEGPRTHRPPGRPPEGLRIRSPGKSGRAAGRGTRRGSHGRPGRRARSGRAAQGRAREGNGLPDVMEAADPAQHAFDCPCQSPNASPTRTSGGRGTSQNPRA